VLEDVLADGAVHGNEGDLLALDHAGDGEARYVDAVIAQNGADLADNAGAVHDLEGKECPLGDNVEMEAIEKDDPAQFIGEDGTRYGGLLDVGLEAEDDEIVELVELLRF